MHDEAPHHLPPQWDGNKTRLVVTLTAELHHWRWPSSQPEHRQVLPVKIDPGLAPHRFPDLEAPSEETASSDPSFNAPFPHRGTSGVLYITPIYAPPHLAVEFRAVREPGTVLGRVPGP